MKGQDLLPSLNNYPIVRVFDQNMNTVITIGTSSDSEHEAAQIAREFVEKLKVFYEGRSEK